MPTERIRLHGLRNGILLYSRQTAHGRFGHWFMIAPPLTISDEESAELLRRTEAAVNALSDELRTEGIL